ncbi:hypothetical protein TNCV_1913201 [Trichonephila clavipes]|nr:hypothetical protein TNCV_1913201 [Trichonephila clavipes]
MSPNTLRVHTEFVLVKSVGLKILWAVAAETTEEQLQGFASLEAVDRRPPNKSENWQLTTEGDISVRRSTPAPHSGE